MPAETLELLALLSDLQRYGTLSPEDVRREVTAATQTLNRQRTDANRVRLAVLFTLAKTSPQDDQRALQLLDNVAKSNPGSPAVKQVAVVLQAQISERLRAVQGRAAEGRRRDSEARSAAGDGAQPDARSHSRRRRRRAAVAAAAGSSGGGGGGGGGRRR